MKSDENLGSQPRMFKSLPGLTDLFDEGMKELLRLPLEKRREMVLESAADHVERIKGNLPLALAGLLYPWLSRRLSGPLPADVLNNPPVYEAFAMALVQVAAWVAVAVGLWALFLATLALTRRPAVGIWGHRVLVSCPVLRAIQAIGLAALLRWSCMQSRSVNANSKIPVPALKPARDLAASQAGGCREVRAEI
ncbi:hypothetical protein [Solimonas sp. SE-A11]|uniref:hypothetical protein n=1 Tax=Solimonas sp. SE-A11 TaxID=3054954 RepID=UPI00259C73B4|nr:hypothetical protein [Solimonas sp. SE-A11]MDM4770870.1 hypothetical protein [Solimonas sp. SE-A11]